VKATVSKGPYLCVCLSNVCIGTAVIKLSLF
jgi:hypothetical protein